jgi:hypothetical protein
MHESEDQRAAGNGSRCAQAIGQERLRETTEQGFFRDSGKNDGECEKRRSSGLYVSSACRNEVARCATQRRLVPCECNFDANEEEPNKASSGDAQDQPQGAWAVERCGHLPKRGFSQPRNGQAKGQTNEGSDGAQPMHTGPAIEPRTRGIRATFKEPHGGFAMGDGTHFA